MLTISDVAKRIGYNTTTTWCWVREGFLPAPVTKVGRLNLWDEQEIMTFCRKRNFINAFAY